MAGGFLAVLMMLGKPEELGVLFVSFPATFLLSCPVIFDGGGTMSKPDTSPTLIDCRFREGGGGGDESFIFPEALSYLAYPLSKFDIVWRRLLGNNSGNDIIFVGVLHLLGVVGGELSGGRGGEEAGDAWGGRLQVSKLWRRYMAGRGGGFLVALFSPPLLEVVMVGGLLLCDIGLRHPLAIMLSFFDFWRDLRSKTYYVVLVRGAMAFGGPPTTTVARERRERGKSRSAVRLRPSSSWVIWFRLY